MEKNKKVKVYMDGVDYMYEVGHASDGNKVYPDTESLREHNRCWEGCGIVECELVFKKWVVKHDWERMAGDSINFSAEELKNNADILRLESAQKHLEWLEKQVSKQKHKVIELKVNLKKKGKK
jgi:hypothetical protein